MCEEHSVEKDENDPHEAMRQSPSLFLFHNHLGAFTFARVEDDGLMRCRFARCGAAAMSVAMEVKLATTKSPPKQTRRRERDDDERDDGLPVHDANIKVRVGASSLICPSRCLASRSVVSA